MKVFNVSATIEQVSATSSIKRRAEVIVGAVKPEDITLRLLNTHFFLSKMIPRFITGRKRENWKCVEIHNVVEICAE